MSERDLFLNGRSQLVLSIGSVTKCVIVFVRDREREEKAREREADTRERRKTSSRQFSAREKRIEDYFCSTE